MPGTAQTAGRDGIILSGIGHPGASAIRQAMKKLDNKRERKIGMGKEKLLDILAKERMGTALEEALKEDGEYQHEMGEQETAFGEMVRLLPGGELEAVVDKAISATNSCGAAYGAAAYRQGFKDGVRVARELGRIA